MVRKTLGHVELEWTCPQCGTRNPGPQKMCLSCGKPQPESVDFHQAAEEELITDADEIARAAAGPDVHCAFCGTRNPATAEKCSQCGADLGSATARESGQVLGAHRAGPAGEVTCPKCGASNPATALRCSQCNASLPRKTTPAPKARPAARRAKPKGKLGLPVILGIGVAVLVGVALCVLVVLSLLPGKTLTGEVHAVAWERSIAIEELRDVSGEDWRDEIPSGARLGTCTERHRRTQDEPAPGAEEVCGTPYTVDLGNGFGEVRQDCQYKVYDDWCTYTLKKWKVVNTTVRRGKDLDPRWPDLQLAAGQREGSRKQEYTVVFDTDEKTYTYVTSDEGTFQRCQVGTRWVLRTNVLGGIRSISPDR
jgi:ribosomal protein L40E